MHRSWYTPQEKKEIEELLYSNKILLDKMKTICYDKIKEKERTRRGSQTYDCPNWAEQQADLNGYLRCLYELEQLFTLDEKE